MNAPDVRYEWAIFRGEEFWRGPWLLGRCRWWIDEFEQDGGRPGAFQIKRRAVGEWEDEQS